jgi:hypothetical protein
MRPRPLLLFTALAFSGLANAQTYWGTKSRWGVAPSISHLPVVLFKYAYGDSGIDVIDTIHRDGVEIDVDALACHPVLGLVAWEVTPSGSQMVLLDSMLATAQNLGPYMAGRQVRGACYDREQNIFALDHGYDELLTISGTDGSVLASVNLSLGGSPFDLVAACDLDRIGDAWYIYAQFSLYQLNTATGEVVFMFTDTAVDPGDNVNNNCNVVPAICGIAELPQAGIGSFIAVDGNCQDDLFQYNVITADSRAELVHDITPSFNSGAEDLALAVAPQSTPIAVAAPVGSVLVVTLIPRVGLRVNSSAGPLNGPIELLDSTGRLLHAARGNGSSSQVLVWDLPRGLFILRVGGESQRSVRVLAP